MARVAAQYAYMVSSDFESPEARYALGPYTPVDPREKPIQSFDVPVLQLRNEWCRGEAFSRHNF